MFSRLGVIGGLALAIFLIGKTANAIMGVDGPDSAPPVMVFKNGDAEMDAAHAKAVATIGDFWSAMERKTPTEDNFSLKVRLPVPGKDDSGEHVWLLDIKRSDGGMYSGRLDNKPRFVTNVRIGDRVTFSDAMISDWMFTRNGKIVGNESMRPMLARMPKEKADLYRTMLENP
ncbi:MAG: YegJ family protein [Hyphomicrobium sp.]